MTEPTDRLDGMVAVVTGASGFIGSHLVDALVDAGARLHVLVREGALEAAARVGVTTHRCDLLDAASVAGVSAWREATHCFHVGGVTKGRTRSAFDAGNVLPTQRICAAMAAQGRHAMRLVYVSSQAAAGPATLAGRPVREDDEPRPVEAYGASKLAAEQVVAGYSGLSETVIVRPSSVYGPRDRDFLAAFRQATGRVAVHAVPRTQEIAIVHVADLVRALILASITPSAAGRCYFVGNEAPVSFGALYGEIARAAGVRPWEVQVPRFVLELAGAAADMYGALTGHTGLISRQKVALGKPPRWHCDVSRARVELGWSAQIPLAQGVRETLAWYRQAGWLPRGRS